jgi:hypothetical protein
MHEHTATGNGSKLEVVWDLGESPKWVMHGALEFLRNLLCAAVFLVQWPVLLLAFSVRNLGNSVKE